MNAIIATTDFSASSANAVRYAAAFADATGARLVLFHHFIYPAPATDVPFLQPLVYVDEMSASHERHLADIRAELLKVFPKLDISTVVRSLSLQEDLEELFHEEEADIVVMGTKAHSPLSSVLLGSVSSKTIRRGKLPVLLVPECCSYHTVQKILFPSDRHYFGNAQILQPLHDAAKTFSAYVEVLTLGNRDDLSELAAPSAEHGTPTRSNLSLLLGDVQHGFSYENERDVQAGIVEEAARVQADWVAMVPHHHSVFATLFNTSETQRVAGSLKLPLLVLGERVPHAPEEAEPIDAVL